MVVTQQPEAMKVVSNPKDFDEKSGNLLERLIFNNRRWVMLACLLLTTFFALQLPRITISASYDKMLPRSQLYIRNFLENRSELRGLGDTVRIVVENPHGDVYDPAYLDTLGKINDDIFLLPGVDRPWMKSMFTPVVRWTEVTEDGFVGGPVLPSGFDGSPASIQRLRINIARAGVVGTLVANDYRSSMIVVPLMAVGSDGKPLDYHALSLELDKIREKYSKAGSDGKPVVRMHIVGFAKLVGDLIDGLGKVMYFFAISAAIASIVIFLFTRCVRSTVLVIGCSLVAVVWQLGIVTLLGRSLDPFSMLVPFLVFSIGVSHGAQKMNGIMLDVGRGTHRWVAARYTYRRLFLAGMTALLADAVGFAVLAVIDIPAIRELAVTASLGVAVLIFTNLILLPVLLSYVGVSNSAAKRSLRQEHNEADGKGAGQIWRLLDRFATPRWAAVALIVAGILAIVGYLGSRHLEVGDLDPGAPELRAHSRYNVDNAYITGHYGVSSDEFAVMVKTPANQCSTYENLIETDRLAWTLAQIPGVQRTASLADTMRSYTMGSFEGSPKWMTISESQGLIDPQINNALAWNSEYLNANCSLIPVIAYLTDHKAETLQRITDAVTAFAAGHDTADRKFLLAAGNAGVDAATNIVVRRANHTMLLYVYGAVILLCAVTFRNWRAVVVAVLPLALTSLLAEAVMAALGIGVKVATLPVVALGVGIGVDYALYLLSVQLAHQRRGETLQESYKRAVGFTGKIVGLVGVTLAAGVVTWAWSPIKFQADMGVMLTFMFLWNMVGALVLIPALSCFFLRDVPSRTSKLASIAKQVGR